MLPWSATAMKSWIVVRSKCRRGARMGADPKTSVVNADCRTHDIPNLYVVDGSVFPSASEKNPTHTIMALAARTADNIGDRLSRKEM